MAEVAARRVTAQSGQTCNESGPYRSSRNAKVVIFVKRGTPFPNDTDGARTTWTLVTSDQG